ncbi:protein kinase [Nocardiopsis sediminis]|uniref:Protein kinase n=1 Tax=Nocardiopsis sediminis TaxID=1778267 RepID=A0ABV8FP61_9ACTN
MTGTGPLTDDDPRTVGGYTLTGRLGQGGQGVVYLGQGSDGVPVAVKTLHADDLDAAGLRRQLAEEVETARRVARFCTAQVLAADIDADPPYVVSEYIDGPTLREVVRRDGPLRGAALERLAVGTLTAIAAIHQAGIVHRDFKPGNVLMGPDGPRVIDFGIARALEGTAIVTSRIAGTPAYMAPEQITGGAMGPPVDLFAWAGTIVYAANGHGPFGQDSMQAILQRVLYEPADLGQLEGNLRRIAERCLDKDARGRPSAAETLLGILGVEAAAAASAVAPAPDAAPAAELPLQTLAAGVVAAAAPEAQERAAADVHRTHPSLPRQQPQGRPGPAPHSGPQQPMGPRPPAPPTGPQFSPQYPGQYGPPAGPPGGGPPPGGHPSGPYPAQPGAPAGGWAQPGGQQMSQNPPGPGGPGPQGPQPGRPGAPTGWESGPNPAVGPNPATGPGPGFAPTGPGPAYPTGPGQGYGPAGRQGYPTGPEQGFGASGRQGYPGPDQGYGTPGGPQGYPGGPDQGYGPAPAQQPGAQPAQWGPGAQTGAPAWQQQPEQPRRAGTGMVVGLLSLVAVLVIVGAGLLIWAFTLIDG